MRIRVVIALPMILLLGGCGTLAATVSKPAPAASDLVIPWTGTKPAAYHLGLAVPIGEAAARACRADDLTATYVGAMGLTNGQMTGAIDFANVSSTPCVLEGIAAVYLFGAKGATISASAYTTLSTATPVVLQSVTGLSSRSVSAGHASVEIDWSLYDEAGAGSCPPGLAQAAAIGITVPGGGTVTTSAISPRDGPITFCPPRFGVGAFQPATPAGAAPLVPGQYFQATLKVPPTAIVGQALNF